MSYDTVLVRGLVEGSGEGAFRPHLPDYRAP